MKKYSRKATGINKQTRLEQLKSFYTRTRLDQEISENPAYKTINKNI